MDDLYYEEGRLKIEASVNVKKALDELRDALQTVKRLGGHIYFDTQDDERIRVELVYPSRFEVRL